MFEFVPDFAILQILGYDCLTFGGGLGGISVAECLETDERGFIVAVCGEHIGHQHFQNVGAVRGVKERIFFAETYHLSDRLRGLGIFGAGFFQFLGKFVDSVGVVVHGQHSLLKIGAYQFVDAYTERIRQFDKCGFIINRNGFNRGFRLDHGLLRFCPARKCGKLRFGKSGNFAKFIKQYFAGSGGIIDDKTAF